MDNKTKPINCKKCGRTLFRMEEWSEYNMVTKCKCGAEQQIIITKIYSVDVKLINNQELKKNGK